MSDQRRLAQDNPLGAGAGLPDVESFVVAHLAGLNRVARALCRSRDASDDLVADTIAAVVGKWSTITAPAAYARRTMIHLFLNDVRHGKVIQEISVEFVPEPYAGSSGAIDDAVSRIDIDRALGRLRPELRAVLVLRFLSDLPVADVALILQRPAGSIRRLTHEAIAALRIDGLLDGARNGPG